MTQFEKDAEEILPCSGADTCWSREATLKYYGHKETCPAFHRPIIAARFEQWYNQGMADLMAQITKDGYKRDLHGLRKGYNLV